MSGAALLRFAILMVPVLLSLVAVVGASLSLRSREAPEREPVYLEHAGPDMSDESVLTSVSPS